MAARTLPSFALLLVLLGLNASAQESLTARGFALDRFNPSDRGSDWFSLESLDIRGGPRLAAGVVLDYAHNPLVVYTEGGTARAALVADQGFAHVGASVVLAERFRLGLNVPVALGGGQDAVVSDISYKAPQGGALGDVRLSAQVRLLGEPGDRFVLALGVRLYAPTGSRDQFTGDGYIHGEPEVLVAGDVDSFAYAGRVSAHLRALHEDFDGVRLGNELRGGLSAGLRVLDRKLLVGPELLVSAGLSGAETLGQRANAFEVLLGAHYALGDWKVGAGVGPGLGRGLGTPQFRGLLSIEWAPPYTAPPLDSDHDGIPDAQDACPTVPGVKSADPAKNGCPILDSDKDGIPDSEDACPTVPGVKDADPKKNGCPAADSDNDGIPDAQDACPTVPGVKSDDPKKNGCPLDSDNDGIPDSEDACPTVPGAKSDDPKKNGCPLDSDNDGIPDAQDACPTVPGVKSDDPKKNGCPPDFDNDGIPDAEDACPKAPGVKNADPEKNGCPLDSDNDGIPDAQDACPDKPGIKDADPAKNGCPAAPNDADKDGIPDAQDACPTKPGIKSTDKKKNGCPAVSLEKKQIKLNVQIQFATGSATILKESFPILEQVATILKANPEINLRVEGHTDDRGGAVKNKDLSERRAASVVDWLVKAGIDRGRLANAGFGQERPIDTNKTNAGRANNRRVEFHIVETNP